MMSPAVDLSVGVPVLLSEVLHKESVLPCVGECADLSVSPFERMQRLVDAPM